MEYSKLEEYINLIITFKSILASKTSIVFKPKKEKMDLINILNNKAWSNNDIDNFLGVS